MAVQDYTEPNVCIDENLSTDASGLLVMQPYAVPRRVANVKALSGGDGTLFPETALPGKLLINAVVGWRNTTPLPAQMMIRVVRASKSWITSNPNAIQFRDRWTYKIDPDDVAPTIPVTTGIYNSQCGSANDLGTNSVAEPNPGKQWMWADGNAQDEWIGEAATGDKVNVHYRQYVWTPPPFSDNANKNKPEHVAYGNWVRVELWAYAMQPGLVTG